MRERSTRGGAIVGRYDMLDATNTVQTHGFLRSVDGTFTSVDVRGASTTIAAGIDSGGVIVGVYSGRDNVNHGFLRSINGNVTTFDVVIPGVNVTSSRPAGINSLGEIVGFYTSADPITNVIRRHGFLLSR